jgi:signal transduction histidine kinase
LTAHPPDDPDDHRAPLLTPRSADLEEAKRAFLRTVSHELRTPLNAIIGFSEIMASELYGPLGAPQYRDYARHIRESGYRLLRLVNQVLEIARLQGQPTDMISEPQALDHVLDDVRDRLSEALRTTAVRMVVIDEGRLPSVMADAKGVRTLLFNLVQNAVLHGGSGGLVEIRAAKRGGWIDIEVRDHGQGVEPAELSRMLAPFELGDDALTRTSHGVGLGLPIARLLAETMGGQLGLASTPGDGLSAVASLPAARRGLKSPLHDLPHRRRPG